MKIFLNISNHLPEKYCFQFGHLLYFLIFFYLYFLIYIYIYYILSTFDLFSLLFVPNSLWRFFREKKKILNKTIKNLNFLWKT